MPALIVYGFGLLITFSVGWLTGVGFAMAGGIAIAHGTVLLRDDVIVGVLIASFIGLVLGPIREGAAASFSGGDVIGFAVMVALGVYVWVMQQEAKTGKEFSAAEFISRFTGSEPGSKPRKRYRK